MRKYIIPSLKVSEQADRLCPRCSTASNRIHQRRCLSVTNTRFATVTKLRLLVEKIGAAGASAAPSAVVNAAAIRPDDSQLKTISAYQTASLEGKDP